MYLIEVFKAGISEGYLSRVDFEANGPNYPTGHAECSMDPKLAIQFASYDQALGFYLTRSQTCPRRPDGKINRPLRALTVQIVPMPAKPAAVEPAGQDWRREFPDFPADAMPALPGDFTDTSHHNCAMPSWTSDQRGMTLWVDYPDEAMREFKGRPRFLLEKQDHGIETGHEIIATDDWRAVQEKIFGMPPCRFTMADGEVEWDGFSHGSTWNGFDNVAVERSVLDQIIAMIGVSDEADQLKAIEPMKNGLYSLGWCWATEITPKAGDPPRYEVGGIMQWGTRAIFEVSGAGYGRKIAEVPLPGGTRAIEERRAERDRTAEMIVAALNSAHRKG